MFIKIIHLGVVNWVQYFAAGFFILTPNKAEARTYPKFRAEMMALDIKKYLQMLNEFEYIEVTNE